MSPRSSFGRKSNTGRATAERHFGSMGAVRLIRGMLFETSPLDPLVFTIVVALLALGGLAACLIPARRATSISPMAALREE